MRNRLVVVLIGGLALAGAARAGEEKIARSELPVAVERTVAAQRAEAERGFSRETTAGRTLYEAELTVNGRRRDLLIDAAGIIVEVEEEIPFATLPESVQLGLKEAAGSGTVVRVESITKGKRLVAYEAEIESKGKKSEVQVGPDGKRLGKRA